MSGCKFPEHHGSGGIDIVPIAVVIGLVVMGASAITAIIHILTMILTFVALGAAVTLALGVPLWLHRRRSSRQLVTQYRPQMAPGRRTELLREQEQPALEQHVHHHYGISLEELAAAIRGQQGGPNGR